MGWGEFEASIRIIWKEEAEERATIVSSIVGTIFRFVAGTISQPLLPIASFIDYSCMVNSISSRMGYDYIQTEHQPQLPIHRNT